MKIVKLHYIFAVSSIAIIFCAFAYSFPPVDEGMHLYNALRISRGEIIYKDFYSYLTPLTYYLGASINTAFDDNFLTPRFLNLFITVFSFPLFVKYSKSLNIDGNDVYFVSIFYIICILPAGFVYSHHNLSNFFFLALLVICTKEGQFEISESLRDKLKPIVLGAVVTLIAMTHQSHGFYVFLAIALYLILQKKWLYVIIYTSTISFVFILFFGELFATARFDNFFYGAIYWNLEVYRKYLSYSPISEQLYLFKTLPAFSVQFLEAILVSVAKLIILCVAIYCLVYRKYISDVVKVAIILIVSYFLGNAQTTNAISFYQVLGVSLPILWAFVGSRRIFYTVVFTLMCVQIARVTTYPIRTLVKYHQYGTCSLNNITLICTPEFMSVIKLNNFIADNDIAIAAVIGRSPSLYGFLSINNVTMHDLIYPIFTEREKLDNILYSLHEKYVITDFTDEIIKLSTNHTEVKAYHPRIDEFLSWPGYERIKNGMIYRNTFFGIARLSTYKDN